MKENLKDLSKSEIVIERPGSGVSNELIITSALMRIADNTELMAKNFLTLQANEDYYRTEYRKRGKEIEALQRTIRALKGHLTRKSKQPAE